ncbi:ABC transporter, ATP-binding [Sulfitobacter noctilucae]|uniref:FliH/SctL family protein n=1 Tax=Sulfitobacter noctilucae TaxID=1342302 RepID=UPI000469696A|nr:hypothetical protein [Sulfitobacter noctilucae]KIN65939.1 ABC transporter, ATP-binding [Sulfitobacter noctilucae]
MSVSHRYQSFDVDASAIGTGSNQTDDQLEDIRLTGFEAGYQAGWEDAVKAQVDADAKLTADFVNTLQDMSFTYHEAYAKLNEGMKPLFAQLVAKLLPEVAAQSLGVHVLSQISALTAAESGSTIEIVVSPAKEAAVRKLLDDQAAVPFVLATEASMTAGQVYLRAGSTEREINLDAVLKGISDAISAFVHTAQEEPKDG